MLINQKSECRLNKQLNTTMKGMKWHEETVKSFRSSIFFMPFMVNSL